MVVYNLVKVPSSNIIPNCSKKFICFIVRMEGWFFLILILYSFVKRRTILVVVFWNAKNVPKVWGFWQTVAKISQTSPVPKFQWDLHFMSLALRRLFLGFYIAFGVESTFVPSSYSLEWWVVSFDFRKLWVNKGRGEVTIQMNERSS
jgi:hypothetical protein